MRVIARSTLVKFSELHPETRVSLFRWLAIVKTARWTSPLDVLQTFPKAKVLNAERVRFEIHGGVYRLIVAFDFKRHISFIKFAGTHAEYDRIDALRISMAAGTQTGN